MKTIPVSVILVVAILTPAFAFAEGSAGGAGKPPREGSGKRVPRSSFAEVWKKVDKNGDRFISEEEFAAMPRIENLPEDKRQELFRRLDKNGDGKLGRDELSRMRKPQGEPHRPMQHLWELDVDQSGGVSEEEFKVGRFFKKLPEDRQVELFGRLDTDKDGVITPKDRPVPRFKRDKDKPRPERGKAGGPRREPRDMMRQLDKDGDGVVSFEEFQLSPGQKGLGEDEQEDRFEVLDRNGDHKLTPEEIVPPKPQGGERMRREGPVKPKNPKNRKNQRKPVKPESSK